MKQLFKQVCITLSTLPLWCSCQKFSEEVQSEFSKVISFDVRFDVSQEEVSRASISDAISSIVVYDYVNGELKNEITQSSSDSDFGSVTIDASYGVHKLIFVGHNSGTCSYDATNSLLSFDKVQDTFTFYQELTVSAETESSQSVTLDRQVAAVKITGTDAVPSNAAGIEITVNGYSSKLNPTTGTGSTGESHARSWDYSTTHVGKKGISYLLYTFIPSSEHNVDINIKITGTDGKEIITHTVENVPVTKNQMTIISGNLFSEGITASIGLNSTWGDDIEMGL